jgi:hypothetical protein
MGVRAVTLFALTGLVACGPNTSGTTDLVCRPLSGTTVARPSAFTGTVFTIVMENHSYGDIIGSAAAPYINQLAKQGAIAAGYHDAYVHPSEPNYIWMVAGENFGILNDDDPNAGNVIEAQSHVADQIERAGLTWKSYQESMGAPCGISSQGEYAVKHNPFMYFADINGWNGTAFSTTPRCTEHVVDYSQLGADIAAGTVPDYAFITPNLQHDMHDGTVQQADAWIAAEVPKILASDAYKKGGVLFILWDEGSAEGDNPPFIAVSPNAKPGFASHVSYDTSSYLMTVESILGVQTLPCASQPTKVTPMSDLFTAPLSS